MFEKIRKFYQNRANRFVVNILLVYAGWKLLYFALNHIPAIKPHWDSFAYSFGVFYAGITSFLLNLTGVASRAYGYYILFERAHTQTGIMVSEHCLAIPAMVIFTGIILSFPGILSQKLVFILFGLCIIFIINVVRLLLLCVVYINYPKSVFDFFHTYFYVVVTYALIFLMVAWWMRRAEDKPAPPATA